MYQIEMKSSAPPSFNGSFPVLSYITLPMDVGRRIWLMGYLVKSPVINPET